MYKELCPQNKLRNLPSMVQNKDVGLLVEKRRILTQQYQSIKPSVDPSKCGTLCNGHEAALAGPQEAVV